MTNRVTRRTVLAGAAGTAGGLAVVGAGAAGSAQASPSQSTGNYLGRSTVLEASGGSAHVAYGSDSQRLPLHGFPGGYVPAAGEHVVVSDDLGSLMIFPLVASVEGEISPQKTISIGGKPIQVPKAYESRSGVASRVRAWFASNVRTGVRRIVWIRASHV